MKLFRKVNQMIWKISFISCLSFLFLFTYLFNSAFSLYFYWIICTLTHFSNCWFSCLQYRTFPYSSPSLYVGHVYMRVLQWEREREMCVYLPLGCVLKFEGGCWQWLTVTGNASHPTGANQHGAQLNPVTLFRCSTLSIGNTAVVCMDVCVHTYCYNF